MLTPFARAPIDVGNAIPLNGIPNFGDASPNCNAAPELTRLGTKRLSSGRFRFWRNDGSAATLDPHQLHVLLAAGDWTRTPAATYWRKVP